MIIHDWWGKNEFILSSWWIYLVSVNYAWWFSWKSSLHMRDTWWFSIKLSLNDEINRWAPQCDQQTPIIVEGPIVVLVWIRKSWALIMSGAPMMHPWLISCQIYPQWNRQLIGFRGNIYFILWYSKWNKDIFVQEYNFFYFHYSPHFVSLLAIDCVVLLYFLLCRDALESDHLELRYFNIKRAGSNHIKNTLPPSSSSKKKLIVQLSKYNNKYVHNLMIHCTILQTLSILTCVLYDIWRAK